MSGAVAEVGAGWVSRTMGSISQELILVFCWTELIALEDGKTNVMGGGGKKTTRYSAWNLSVCKVTVRPE